MEDLKKIFLENETRLINKWTNYFPVYEKHFNKYKGKSPIILEIGVFHGGSLLMWKKYFGEGVKIYGIDLDPKCKQLEEENISIFIGSQQDEDFLEQVKAQIPKVDILLDDGGHTMKQQITTFNTMFDHIKDDGVYLCEDCHTSYWADFGGGYLRKGTFIEFSKKLIDKLNAWHFKKLPVDEFTKGVWSVSFYDSIVVIEKEKIEKPESIMTGKPVFPLAEDTINTQEKILSVIEKILAFFRLPSFSK